MAHIEYLQKSTEMAHTAFSILTEDCAASWTVICLLCGKKKYIRIPSSTAWERQQLNKSPFSVPWYMSQCRWCWQPKENTWLHDTPVALGEALQGTRSRSARNIHHKLTERHSQEQNKKWCQGPSQRQCNCQKMVRRMRNNYNIVMPFWSEVWVIHPSVPSLYLFQRMSPATAHHIFLLHPQPVFFLILTSHLSFPLAEIFFVLHSVNVHKWSPNVLRLEAVTTEDLLMPLRRHAPTESRWI